MDVEELLDKAAPYFATKEELLALTSTINRIRQREINSTDADVLKAQREFLQDAENEIARASAEAKLNRKKPDRAMVLVDEQKPN
jgi:DNA-binding transcriptional regulator GbsR (MarR family)